jgi:hypothetical protein
MYVCSMYVYMYVKKFKYKLDFFFKRRDSGIRQDHFTGT